MLKDKYENFSDLAGHEKEGLDFDIETADRNSPYIVIAIHGGEIEPGTTEIARQIAGDNLSFYSFIGKKGTEEESEELHIMSSNFDEPRCLSLVSKSDKAISIHGKYDSGDFVMVGGLDKELIDKVSNIFKENGFDVPLAPEDVNGNSPENICNRCLSKEGLQLEISRGLRERLLKDQAELQRFCELVRSAL
jgi:phage replication-related protein YjqB (UPF0714/DUF867 family)